MTKEELDAIKARCEVATPGAWERNWNWEWDRTIHGDPSMQGDPFCVAWGESPVVSNADFNVATEQAQADAAFIAAARTDVPALVAEVEQLQAKLDKIAALAMPYNRDSSIDVYRLSQIRDVLRGEEVEHV